MATVALQANGIHSSNGEFTQFSAGWFFNLGIKEAVGEQTLAPLPNDVATITGFSFKALADIVGSALVNDTLTFYVSIVDSSGSALTNEASVAYTTDPARTAFEISASVLNSNPSAWVSARLKVRLVTTANMGADGSRLEISGFSVAYPGNGAIITYTPTNAPPTVALDTLNGATASALQFTGTDVEGDAIRYQVELYKDLLGTFTPTSVTITGSPCQAVVMDDTHVYLTTDLAPQVIVRINKGTGAQDTLTLTEVDSSTQAVEMLVDVDYIYVTQNGNVRRLCRISKSDFSTQAYVTLLSGDYTSGLAQDSSYVYTCSTNTSPGVITRVSKADFTTVSTVTLPASTQARSLGVDDSYLYVGSFDKIIRINKSSFTIQDIITTVFVLANTQIESVFTNDSYIFGVWQGSSYNGAYRIRKRDLAMSSLTRGTAQGAVGATDGIHIYFAQYGTMQVASVNIEEFATWTSRSFNTSYSASPAIDAIPGEICVASRLRTNPDVYFGEVIDGPYPYTSGTDSGFSGSPDNTDPFTSGQQITFTLPAEITAGTWNWRVRGIDP